MADLKSRDGSKKPEGRERYLDMVQRERSLLVEKGISRTVEQLLVAAGGLETSDEEQQESVQQHNFRKWTAGP